MLFANPARIICANRFADRATCNAIAGAFYRLSASLRRNLYDGPSDAFCVKDRWQQTFRAFDRQPNGGRIEAGNSNCLKVQQVEFRMAQGHFSHDGNNSPRFGERNLSSELQQRGDCSLLELRVKLAERTRKMSTSASYCSSTSPVVPVCRGRKLGCPAVCQPTQKVLDQQTVIEENARHSQRALLIDEVGVVNRGKADLVTVAQDPT